MKRLVAAFAFLALAFSPAFAANEWTDVAARVYDSIAYLTGPQGSCTAWTIDSKRYFVLSAAHCYQEVSGVSVVLVDNVPARLVAKDTKKDLLVLQVPGLDRPALKLAKSNPKIGDVVASYGFGLALERPLFRVTHISDDKLYVPFEGIGGPFIITDSNFVGGQSGAPVVDLNGDVVMIVQMGSSVGFGLGVGAETIRDKMGRYFERVP